MSVQYSSSTVSLYNQKLQSYQVKIGNDTITQSELNQAKEIAIQYYDYLRQSGISYGQVASEVIQESTFYGSYANGMMVDAIKNNSPLKSDSEIQLNKDKVAISLALEDSYLRQQNTDGNLTSRQIADYHYDVFASYNLPKETWGGALFEEFVGPGSWMDVKDNKTLAFEKISYLAFDFLKNGNRTSEGVSGWGSILKIVDFSSGFSAGNVALKNFATDLVYDITDYWNDLNNDVVTVVDYIQSSYQSFATAVANSIRPKDPLIIDKNNDGLKLSSWQNSGVRFDLDGNGTTESNGWTVPSSLSYNYAKNSGAIVIDESNAALIDKIIFAKEIAKDDLIFTKTGVFYNGSYCANLEISFKNNPNDKILKGLD